MCNVLEGRGLERERREARIWTPGRPGRSAPMAGCRDVASPAAGRVEGSGGEPVKPGGTKGEIGKLRMGDAHLLVHL